MLSIFPLWTDPAYGEYVFQLIRYSRACGYYRDFLDRGLMLPRKLLNQGFLVVRLKPLLWELTVATMHLLINCYGIYVSQMTTICSVCHNYTHHFLTHVVPPYLCCFWARVTRRCHKWSRGAYPSRTHVFISPPFLVLISKIPVISHLWSLL